jgi:hypothetical protein
VRCVSQTQLVSIPSVLLDSFSPLGTQESLLMLRCSCDLSEQTFTGHALVIQRVIEVNISASFGESAQNSYIELVTFHTERLFELRIRI